MATGGITPWTKGQLSPTWTIPMVRDGGGIMDLTGVTTGQLSLIIYTSTYTIVGNGAGTFTIVSAKPGVVRYAPASADVSTVGTFYVRVEVNFNGTSPDYSDYLLWQVNL